MKGVLIYKIWNRNVIEIVENTLDCKQLIKKTTPRFQQMKSKVITNWSNNYDAIGVNGLIVQ